MAKSIVWPFSFFMMVILNLYPLFVLAVPNDLRLCSQLELSEGEFDKWYILSESMVPALRQGDSLLVLDAYPFDSIKTGDIIAFREPVPDGETADVIVSRVRQLMVDPLNSTVILTKGDANSGSIPGIDFPIYESNYVGKAYCLALDGASSTPPSGD